jgi:hypothetical protein
VDAVGPRPRAPEVLAPVLQLSQCLAAILSRITYRAMRDEPISSVVSRTKSTLGQFLPVESI